MWQDITGILKKKNESFSPQDGSWAELARPCHLALTCLPQCAMQKSFSVFVLTDKKFEKPCPRKPLTQIHNETCIGVTTEEQSIRKELCKQPKHPSIKGGIIVIYLYYGMQHSNKNVLLDLMMLTWITIDDIWWLQGSEERNRTRKKTKDTSIIVILTLKIF